MSPSPSALPTAGLLGRGLGVLLVLLDGLGIIVCGVGLGEVASPLFPAHAQSRTPQPLTERQELLLSQARTATSREERQSWTATTELVAHGPPPDIPVCLGMDLAVGRRAESTHQATVSLQLPGACGNLREALVGMALAHGVSADLGAHGSATDPHQPPHIDLTAAALFGPPDWQPEALLSEEVLNGVHADPRSALEQATWAGWVAPSTAPPWPRG